MILAFILLLLRFRLVLKTSVTSMTSTDKITSLASMTSIVSLASNFFLKKLALYILNDFLAWETLAALITSIASTISVTSMTSSASFHQKLLGLIFFHQPWHQNDLFWSNNVGWIIKNSPFSWFPTPFLLEAVENRDFTVNQIKGSYVKFPLLIIPK